MRGGGGGGSVHICKMAHFVLKLANAADAPPNCPPLGFASGYGPVTYHYKVLMYFSSECTETLRFQTLF